MDFDHPSTFEFIDYTGDCDKIMELHWKVSFPSKLDDKHTHITIVTTVTNGIPDLEYLNYLVQKGARFVDNKEEPIKQIFAGTVPKLISFVYNAAVVKHD